MLSKIFIDLFTFLMAMPIWLEYNHSKDKSYYHIMNGLYVPILNEHPELNSNEHYSSLDVQEEPTQSLSPSKLPYPNNQEASQWPQRGRKPPS